MKRLLLLCWSISLFSAYAQDTLTLAHNFYKSEQFERTVVLLDDYIASHPSDTAALSMAGNAYYQMGLYQIAAQRYTRAIQAGIKNQDIKTDRARCYFFMEEYKAARLEWQVICQQQPDSSNNWYFFALSCQFGGDYNDAIKHLTKALAINSDFIQARKARGNLYLKTQKYQQALYDIDSALMLTQYDEGLFLNRGLSLIGLKRYKEAENTFKRIIEHDEKNQHAWFGLGNMYYAAKDFTKAIDAFDVAIALNPLFELAYFKRGLSHLELRQQEKGCQDLMKSLELGYSDAITYLKKFCNRD